MGKNTFLSSLLRHPLHLVAQGQLLPWESHMEAVGDIQWVYGRSTDHFVDGVD